MTGEVRHFLDLTQFGAEEIRGILAASVDMKRARKRGERQTVRPLEGKTLAMIFDKPSTRTRVSFDVAMRELGGETIMLTGAEMQLGRGETIGDTARVLSRYVDAIVIRMLDQNAVRELAEGATVPVINGLTKASHPCQIMADVMTFEEHRGSIKGRTVAWVGDSNNVLASWVHAASRLDFRINIAAPEQLAPPADLLAWARREGARVSAMTDPYEAVDGADCHRDRLLGFHGRRGCRPSSQPACALSGERKADEGGLREGHLHALPSCPSWRGGDGRGDGRSPVRRLRRSREQAPRPEGCAGMVSWRTRPVTHDDIESQCRSRRSDYPLCR